MPGPIGRSSCHPSHQFLYFLYFGCTATHSISESYHTALLAVAAAVVHTCGGNDGGPSAGRGMRGGSDGAWSVLAAVATADAPNMTPTHGGSDGRRSLVAAVAAADAPRTTPTRGGSDGGRSLSAAVAAADAPHTTPTHGGSDGGRSISAAVATAEGPCRTPTRGGSDGG